HTHESVYFPVAAQLQAVMVAPWESSLDLSHAYSAVLIGPGLAAPEVPDKVKALTSQLWRESAQPVIIDASALAWLPTGPTPKNSIRVITPHPGEAGRMLGIRSDQIQADRTGSLKRISAQFGDCYVVLKGHQTLVGRSTGAMFVNSSG